MIGRNRPATYTRLTGQAGGSKSSSKVVSVPVFQWLRGPRLNSAAGARDEVIAEFGRDAGKLASEILRLRTAMGQAANALTQSSAGGDIIFHQR